MNIQDVLEKVRKLRALATSANVHEAANAAAAADRLIQEHRLHESQIEASTPDASREKAEESPDPLGFGARVQGWRWRLAVLLCAHYEVACYSSWRNGERTLHMVGRKSDVETVRYQVAYFTTEIDRLAAQHTRIGEGRAFFNAFRLGAVSGLIEAMAVEKRDAVTHTASGPIRGVGRQAAMVLVSRAKEARAEMERHHDFAKGGGPSWGRARDERGYSSGKRAGSGLSAAGKARLGGGSGRLLGS